MMETDFNENNILKRIFLIRGQRVMLDFQLAELYGIKTKRLNEQVRRNQERFPIDFMFQLTEAEFEGIRSKSLSPNLEDVQNGKAIETSHLRSQFATSSREGNIRDDFSEWGGRRYLPFAFTEHGVMMLSSVLNSPLAIAMNIRIIRVYIRLREMLSSHLELANKIEYLESKVDRHSEEIAAVFMAIRELMGLGEQTPRPVIGFHQRKIPPE
jgi:hypothetical protein